MGFRIFESYIEVSLPTVCISSTTAILLYRATLEGCSRDYSDVWVLIHAKIRWTSRRNSRQRFILLLIFLALYPTIPLSFKNRSELDVFHAAMRLMFRT